MVDTNVIDNPATRTPTRRTNKQGLPSRIKCSAPTLPAIGRDSYAICIGSCTAAGYKHSGDMRPDILDHYTARHASCGAIAHPSIAIPIQLHRTISLDSKTNLLYWSATQGASGSAPTSTATTLSVSPSSTAAQGATITLTATISPSAAGSVTFKDAGSTIGTATVSSGTASMTTSSPSVGSHSLTAEFASSNTGAYTNSTSSNLGYTITSSGGGDGGSGSNANAVTYISYASGQPHP